MATATPFLTLLYDFPVVPSDKQEKNQYPRFTNGDIKVQWGEVIFFKPHTQ